MSPQESPMNDTVTEMTMTEDFLTRAKLKLKESSSGQFFKVNDAKLLPSFDRGGDESNGEFQLDTTKIWLGTWAQECLFKCDQT